jgi:hypothetical protein
MSLEIEELDPNRIAIKDTASGRSETFLRPPVGGWKLEAPETGGAWDLEAVTFHDLEQLIPLNDPAGAENENNGRTDLALALIGETAGKFFPLRHIHSPLWDCYFKFGFQTMMSLIAARPELIQQACARLLHNWKIKIRKAAALGAAGIWIEECLLDQIHPETYRQLNVPILRELTGEIRSLGLKSILYFCGDPKGRLTYLIDSGCDALGFEESKKNFTIDIAELAGQIKGRCALLGNLDAVELLQKGTHEELQVEIKRQLQAGKDNKGRFIMSVGSPVTPETPLERVQEYCSLVRQLSNLSIKQN